MEDSSLLSALSEYDKTQSSGAQEINVTMHEHRAPTDESIKIYRELEQKAVDSILHKVEVKNNVTTAHIVFFQDMLTMSAKDKVSVAIKFKLNDVEHIIKEEIDRYEFRQQLNSREYGDFGYKKVYYAFYDTVSKLIAVELMKQDGFEDLAINMNENLR